MTEKNCKISCVYHLFVLFWTQTQTEKRQKSYLTTSFLNSVSVSDCVGLFWVIWCYLYLYNTYLYTELYFYIYVFFVLHFGTHVWYCKGSVFTSSTWMQQAPPHRWSVKITFFSASHSRAALRPGGEGPNRDPAAERFVLNGFKRMWNQRWPAVWCSCVMRESAEQDGQQTDNLHRGAAGGVSGDALHRADTGLSRKQEHVQQSGTVVEKLHFY